LDEVSMSKPDAPLTLYTTPLSGHGHRVQQLMLILGLPFRLEAASADVRASAEFRALNPLGQIPVLVDGETVLADSNAIMVYLVRRYAPESGWLPDDPEAAAAVQRWLSIAAGDVAFGPARARAITQWGFDGDLGFAQRVAARLFAFMEQHLADRAFLAADRPTLADLACCDYVAHAPEGGLSLEAYPNIRAWLGRVAANPGFQPLPDPPPADA
jgi:glutathione S-transferase